jgi:transglycosylase-like protein
MRSSKKFAFAAGLLGAVAVPAVAIAATLPPSVDNLAESEAFARAGAIENKLHHQARHALIDETVSLARTVARLEGHKLRNGYRAAISTWSDERLRSKQRQLRAKIDKLQYGGAPAIGIPAALAAIAQCESGGNPRAIGGGGLYRGKYQFDYHTWASVGGKGDPAAAPEGEQDRRAAMLYARAGSSPWPVCGR